MTMSPSDEQRVLGSPLIAASSPIAAGPVARAFELAAAPDRKVALSDFVGQTVILVFYPADWSPVCADQLALRTERRGVYSQQDGTSERALFVIDGAGIVRWSYVSPSGVDPGSLASKASTGFRRKS